MRCLICGTPLSGYACETCDCDISSRAELYPTLAPLPKPTESLGAIRFRIFSRLKEQAAEAAAAAEKPLCRCGNISDPSDRFCVICGNRNPGYSWSRKPSSFSLAQNIWTCECGLRNALSSDYCISCGRENTILKNPAIRSMVFSDTGKASGWDCSCRNHNTDDALFCFACGQPRLNTPAVGWDCSCGARNSSCARFCSVCGKAKPEPEIRTGNSTEFDTPRRVSILRRYFTPPKGDTK